MTSSIFALTGGWCFFQAAETTLTTQALAFERAHISYTSAGDTTQSFVSLGSFALDLSPAPGGLQRSVHGIVREVALQGVCLGNPDLQPLDRTTLSGVRLEVVAVKRWGTEYADIDLAHLGR